MLFNAEHRATNADQREQTERRGEPQLAPFGALFELVNGRPSITRPLSRWQNLSATAPVICF